MKKQILSLIAISVAIGTLVGCKKEEQKATQAPAAGTTPSANTSASSTGVPFAPPFAGGRRTSFAEVTSQLDPGGSLFLYLATDQWLAGLSTNIAQIQQVLMSLPGPRDREDVGRVFDVLAKLVRTSGIEDVTGVGISGAPVAPGLFRNKFIAHHPDGAGKGFLWSMFGRAPHALGGQSMLPTNTALAIFGDLDVTQLWQVLERELMESGIPEAQEAVRNWPQMFEKQTKVPWAGLLASLGGEVGVLLTLEDSRTVELPMGRGTRISLPEPGMVIAVKVNNTLLYEKISAQLQANPNAVTTEEGGLKICSMPVPAPIPLEPAVASSADYFYFASSPRLVRAVQAVRQGREPGLKSSPEFQELARHLPAEGNQFVYVSRRFGGTFAELQQQVVGASGMPQEQVEMLERIFSNAGLSYSLAVGAHTANGWQTISVGNQDSASAALLAPTVGVTAIGAGLLLPALAKAKARAQTINTVSNLKQLGLAARMFSNDNQEKFPKAETWSDDLKTLVGSTKVYKAANDPSPSPCSFAYNAKLSGRDEAKIHPQTVLFFETDNGEWNQSGGPELLLPRPRSGGVYVIGFADGSVQQVPASRLSSLRWDP
jgi:hypothetical protein